MKKSQFDTAPVLSAELGFSVKQVSSVLNLLGDGSTIPFIARYRKEVTGGLDEVQIGAIQERHQYLTELESRRKTILDSIAEQGKLSDELKRKVLACQTKSGLEDLYLPYKPKRRTRATIARERGLEPLALRIAEQPTVGDPAAEAVAFVDEEKGVADSAAALAGARDIVAEMLAERAEVRQELRQRLLDDAILVSSMMPDKEGERTRFEQYYDFREALSTIPSHRFLAIRRGEREGVLRLALECDDDGALSYIGTQGSLNRKSPFAQELLAAIGDAWQRLLRTSLETDVRAELKMRSDGAAVDIFATNLRNLLLSAPLGELKVVAIDPGLRTGCKCVALDATGKYLETVTIFLTKGNKEIERAEEVFGKFVDAFTPGAIAVGNGTGGRETEAFVRRVLKAKELSKIQVVSVNESGASVYSASQVARDEFPELDLTIRGAISIGRRLQDPLAELVKLEPKSIGVGQYQHDVFQPLLTRKLETVVASCVNHVGVSVNTASASLLSYVSGIGPSLAKRIVEFRSDKGAFKDRRQFLAVPGLGPKAFEQAAGFLRIAGGANPLDASAVHPERYGLVESIAEDLSSDVSSLVGKADLVTRIDITRYCSDEVGQMTLEDIVTELKKPGRDPRESFEAPEFRDDVHALEDLTVGMSLEGVVTNVTAFGAFVDVGVHQDGLVHISQLADRFVKDPSDVVSPGQKIRVRVLEVDLERRRISLTARSEVPAESQPRRNDREGARGPAGAGRAKGKPGQGGGKPHRQGSGKKKPDRAKFSNNPFAKLLG